VNIECDVLDRLDGLDRRWYLTGSRALAAYAEPRMTRDLTELERARFLLRRL